MYGMSDDERLLLRILFARLAREIPTMRAEELRRDLADAGGKDLAGISNEYVALTRRAFALAAEATPQQRHSVAVDLLARRDGRSGFEASVAQFRRVGWLPPEGPSSPKTGK